MPVIPACGLELTCIAPHVELVSAVVDYAALAPHVELPAAALDYALLVPWRADPPALSLDYELLLPVFIPVINLSFALSPPVSPLPLLGLTHTLKTPYIFIDPADAAALPRVMRCYLEADGYEDLELSISSMSSRMNYGRQSYISVVVPDVIDSVNAINDRLAGDIVLMYGYKFGDGSEALNELGRVELQDIRTDQGATNFSITLSGYRHETNPTPKEVTVTGVEYISMTNSLRRVRAPVNVNLRPGDLVHIDGEADLVCGAITYTINTTSARMEIGELDDFTLLTNTDDPDQADTVTDANGNETPVLPWTISGGIS